MTGFIPPHYPTEGKGPPGTRRRGSRGGRGRQRIRCRGTSFPPVRRGRSHEVRARPGVVPIPLGRHCAEGTVGKGNAGPLVGTVARSAASGVSQLDGLRREPESPPRVGPPPNWRSFPAARLRRAVPTGGLAFPYGSHHLHVRRSASAICVPGGVLGGLAPSRATRFQAHEFAHARSDGTSTTAICSTAAARSNARSSVASVAARRFASSR